MDAPLPPRFLMSLVVYIACTGMSAPEWRHACLHSHFHMVEVRDLVSRKRKSTKALLLPSMEIPQGCRPGVITAWQLLQGTASAVTAPSQDGSSVGDEPCATGAVRNPR